MNGCQWKHLAMVFPGAFSYILNSNLWGDLRWVMGDFNCPWQLVYKQLGCSNNNVTWLRPSYRYNHQVTCQLLSGCISHLLVHMYLHLLVHAYLHLLVHVYLHLLVHVYLHLHVYECTANPPHNPCTQTQSSPSTRQSGPVERDSSNSYSCGRLSMRGGERGPFYLVSMPGEVKDPTKGVNVWTAVNSLTLEKENSDNKSLQYVSPKPVCLQTATFYNNNVAWQKPQYNHRVRWYIRWCSCLFRYMLEKGTTCWNLLGTHQVLVRYYMFTTCIANADDRAKLFWT